MTQNKVTDSIRRFDFDVNCSGWVEEQQYPDGDYVKHEDYIKTISSLQKRVESAQTVLTRYEFEIDTLNKEIKSIVRFVKNISRTLDKYLNTNENIGYPKKVVADVIGQINRAVTKHKENKDG